MATYRDIDLSFEKNYQNDLSVNLDEVAIKRTLYNNLLVSSQERYFNDIPRRDITDAIHEFSAFSEQIISDCIEDAAKEDPRIQEVSDIRIKSDSDNYKINVEVDLKINTDIDDKVTLNLTIQAN